MELLMRSVVLQNFRIECLTQQGSDNSHGMKTFDQGYAAFY